VTRTELEARVAETMRIFLQLDDWLAEKSDDVEAMEHCLQAHSALAKLYKHWAARLKKEHGR